MTCLDLRGGGSSTRVSTVAGASVSLVGVAHTATANKLQCLLVAARVFGRGMHRCPVREGHTLTPAGVTHVAPHMYL